MSSTTSHFRRPTYRAPSPPTWACYEQIDSGSESESASSDGSDALSDEEGADGDVQNMDLEPSPTDKKDEREVEAVLGKGKQRAAQPPPKRTPRARPPKRERARDPRPILTIHKSQGFVWNQDLFVPPYIKDRYVASTSPPNAKGFAPGSADSAGGGYELEVVDIRIEDGEFDYILRR